MTIWDDIQSARQQMPKGSMDNVDDMLEAIEMALLLWPLATLENSVAKRGYLVRMAACILQGIILLEDKLEAEVDDENTFS